MNKEVKEILDYYQRDIERYEDWQNVRSKWGLRKNSNERDYQRYRNHKILLNYIANLQKENEKLNKIIDGLEKWLEEKEHYYSTTDCQKEIKYEFLRISNEYTKTLDKLAELKKEVE